jgi:hypothetical protein
VEVVVTVGQVPASYPVQFGVDYPEAERNRLTVAFRVVLAIPALIVLWVINTTRALLFLPPLLLILFRNKMSGGSEPGRSRPDQGGVTVTNVQVRHLT